MGKEVKVEEGVREGGGSEEELCDGETRRGERRRRKGGKEVWRRVEEERATGEGEGQR